MGEVWRVTFDFFWTSVWPDGEIAVAAQAGWLPTRTFVANVDNQYTRRAVSTYCSTSNISIC
jgi:hypothetical protein